MNVRPKREHTAQPAALPASRLTRLRLARTMHCPILVMALECGSPCPEREFQLQGTPTPEEEPEFNDTDSSLSRTRVLNVNLLVSA